MLKNVYQNSMIPDLLALFNINPDKFYAIPNLSEKHDFLIYHMLKKEFSILKKGSMIDCDEILALHDAYHQIVNSSLFTEHQNKYTKFSQGLSALFLHSVYSTKTKKDNPKIDLSESVYCTGDKTSGVEPGFKAMLKKDVYLWIFKKFPVWQERSAFIKEYKINIDIVLQNFHKELPEYLFKNTYTDIQNNQIIPDKADLNRSHAIQKVGKMFGGLGKQLEDAILTVWQKTKKKSVWEVNLAAIREVLGNDIARVFGATTQNQMLYPGEFEDTSMALLMLCTWVKGAMDLGGKKGDALAGDNGGNNNYLTKKVVLPYDKISYISDDSIKNLAAHVALFYVLGDWDTIGSLGNNKLRLGNELVCIDFGKAYEENIIKKIAANFKIFNSPPKNFSIFFDSNRSMIVPGLIRLALLKGEHIDNKVLKSYEDINVIPYADEAIFDDYEKCFEEIKNKYEKKSKNYDICDKILNGIREIKKNALTARNEFIEKFKLYLLMTKTEVDFIENIERLIFAGEKKTSLRSPDGTVILNHIRIKPDVAFQWKLSCQDNKRTFTAELTDAKTAVSDLQQWMKDFNQTKLAVNCKNNEITLSYSLDDIDNIASCFAEEKIKQKFHASDYKNYLIYREENLLITFLNQYLPNHSKMSILQKDPDEENYYLLLIPSDFIKTHDKVVYRFTTYSQKGSQLSEGMMLKIHRDDISKINKEIIKIFKEKDELLFLEKGKELVLAVELLGIKKFLQTIDSNSNFVVENNKDILSVTLYSENLLFNQILNSKPYLLILKDSDPDSFVYRIPHYMHEALIELSELETDYKELLKQEQNSYLLAQNSNNTIFKPNVLKDNDKEKNNDLSRSGILRNYN